MSKDMPRIGTRVVKACSWKAVTTFLRSSLKESNTPSRLRPRSFSVMTPALTSSMYLSSTALISFWMRGLLLAASTRAFRVLYSSWKPLSWKQW